MEGRGDLTMASIRLQDLRRRLYVKAKADKDWRFWGLYVHVAKVETLRAAYDARLKAIALCEATGLPQGLRVTAHLADVSNEADVMRFRDEAAKQHATDRIHLLFNNAGIGGGGSMVANSRDEWERTFNICWGGVYLATRAFLPLLQAATKPISSTPAA